MPMTCKVCGHKKRLEIDRALLEGTSLRDIARRTGATASSLQRHKAESNVVAPGNPRAGSLLSTFPQRGPTGGFEANVLIAGGLCGRAFSPFGRRPIYHLGMHKRRELVLWRKSVL